MDWNGKLQSIKNRRTCSDASDVLRGFFSHITDRAQRNLDPRSGKNNYRDQIFDFMMAHVDAWKPYRKNLLAIAGQASFAPILLRLVVQFSRQWSASVDMPESSNIARLLPVYFTILYPYTFWVWMGDDSRDGGKVMAALDRMQSRLEILADKIVSLKDNIPSSKPSKRRKTN